MTISTKQSYRNSVKPTTHAALATTIHGFPNTLDDGPSGIVLFKADGAIKVGDAVILSTVGKVKIATSGAPIGVCVGGLENGTYNVYDEGGVGHSLADGSLVLIATSGIVSCVKDTNNTTIGDRVIVSDGTAGAIKSGTTAGSILGRVLETSSTTGATVKVLIALG